MQSVHPTQQGGAAEDHRCVGVRGQRGAGLPCVWGEDVHAEQAATGTHSVQAGSTGGAEQLGNSRHCPNKKEADDDTSQGDRMEWQREVFLPGLQRKHRHRGRRG